MGHRDRVHWIDQPRALSELGRRLDDVNVIAVDTEQDSYFAYRTKVCVIQIGADGEEWIIDALALDDFAPLAGSFLDRSRAKVLHAGENDVDLLRKNCGLEIRGLFDTMSAASILGYAKTGLAGVIDHHFGVTIEKKYQRSDWRKRPLERAQIEYAALDVRYLPKLRERFKKELEESGRVEEAQSDFDRIERVVHEQREFDPDDYVRIRGARDLDGVGRRILRALYELRDEIAREEDRALFRVCPDHVLVELTKQRPRDRQSLRSFRGVSDRMYRVYGDRVIGVIAAAKRKGPLAFPRRAKGMADGIIPKLEPHQKDLYDELRGWRSRRAQHRGVEVGRVIPNSLLLQIVTSTPRDRQGLAAAGLEPWRIREYGEDILAVVNPEN